MQAVKCCVGKRHHFGGGGGGRHAHEACLCMHAAHTATPVTPLVAAKTLGRGFQWPAGRVGRDPARTPLGQRTRAQGPAKTRPSAEHRLHGTRDAHALSSEQPRCGLFTCPAPDGPLPPDTTVHFTHPVRERVPCFISFSYSRFSNRHATWGKKKRKRAKVSATC